MQGIVVHRIQRRATHEGDLGFYRADQERNGGRYFWCVRIEWVSRQRMTIHYGRQTETSPAHRASAAHCRDELLHRKLLELINLIGLKSQLREISLSRFRCLIFGNAPDCGGAFHNGLDEIDLWPMASPSAYSLFRRRPTGRRLSRCVDHRQTPAMLSRTHSSAATISSIPTLLDSAYFSPPSSARYR